MSAVERQELLDAATARPWEIDDWLVSHAVIYGGVREGVTRTPVCEINTVWENDADAAGAHADAVLIVAAVNEYEALLACEAGLRAIVGFLQPTSRYALHAREALEQLDRVRETS